MILNVSFKIVAEIISKIQTTFKNVFFLCVIFPISKTSLVLFHSLFPWIFCSAHNTVFCVDGCLVPKIVKFDSLQLQSFVCELGWEKFKEFWIGTCLVQTWTFCSLQRKTKTFYNESSVDAWLERGNLQTAAAHCINKKDIL